MVPHLRTRRGRREADRARLFAAIARAALAGVYLAECRIAPHAQRPARRALVEVLVGRGGEIAGLRVLGEGARPADLADLADAELARSGILGAAPACPPLQRPQAAEVDRTDPPGACVDPGAAQGA